MSQRPWVEADEAVSPMTPKERRNTILGVIMLLTPFLLFTGLAIVLTFR